MVGTQKRTDYQKIQKNTNLRYVLKNYLKIKSVIDFCLANEILDLAAIFLHFSMHKISIGVEVELRSTKATREIINWQLILYLTINWKI